MYFEMYISSPRVLQNSFKIKVYASNIVLFKLSSTQALHGNGKINGAKVPLNGTSTNRRLYADTELSKILGIWRKSVLGDL